MNDNSFSVEHEKENIIIHGKPYPFTIFLSAEDYFTLIDALDHKPDQCRRSVAEYIRTRLDVPEDQKPSTDCILAQGDGFFKGIFELLFQSDETLKKLYEVRIDDSDICHRFITAVKTEFSIMPSQQLASNLLPKVQIPSVPIGALEACKMIAERWDGIAEKASAAYINSLNAISAFAQYSDIWFDKIQRSFDIINQIGNTLSSFIQAVHVPELSDERKERLRVSHEVWGKYGWTRPLSSPNTFLDMPPADHKDATAKALKYCKDSDMEKLFAALLEIPHVRKSDVAEAVFAFKNKQYKSCILILFSLIDSRLIRLQRDEDRDRNGRRKSGYGAAKKLFDRISKEQDIQKKTYMPFSYQNIISCLFAVFEDGKDFTEQPIVINRNFVDHGMLIRQVRRKDCVQIFLLYYHFMDFLDAIYGKH